LISWITISTVIGVINPRIIASFSSYPLNRNRSGSAIHSSGSSKSIARTFTASVMFLIARPVNRSSACWIALR
jgi:K+-transporting ATPase c subunit